MASVGSYSSQATFAHMFVEINLLANHVAILCRTTMKKLQAHMSWPIKWLPFGIHCKGVCWKVLLTPIPHITLDFIELDDKWRFLQSKIATSHFSVTSSNVMESETPSNVPHICHPTLGPCMTGLFIHIGIKWRAQFSSSSSYQTRLW